MNIAKKHVVNIHYTLTDDKGETIDTSIGSDPLAYIQGAGNIIIGLENALEGKTKGTKLKVSVKPEEAYGVRNDKMIQVVPKTEIPSSEKVAVGNQFQADTENGPIILTVVEIRPNEVVLDGNHPLAGMNLHFDVEIMDVREATAEELSHGHVHGVGGHHH
ncbi:MAG: peptidylprolyl isomerase [Bacteriovoracaceae bacterium]|nr:peptidylprolyl isomerase [Bacteriovoracaceae bacterium]